MDAEYYRELVGPLVAGKRWILAGAPLAAYTKFVALLQELDAETPFVLASSRGTGEAPEVPWFDLDVQADTMMEGFRRTQALVRDLPAQAREAMDRYDPTREALVMGNPFLPEPAIHGRPVFGWRRPEWLALEDKVVIDALWDSAGVTRLPSMVVPAEPEALRAASGHLDRGSGTVWQGDAREGFNGGAEYLRWIREDSDGIEAGAFFSAHCDRVRVAPFAEGIPTSIHGVVFPEEVIRFRPVELLTLRRIGENRLHYAGTATFWDPPDADREEMRAAALRVGSTLREHVGYRGPFTVDGILTEEGFRPTELNTRAGAGLNGIAGALPGLPLTLVMLAVIEGQDLDYRPRELEDLVVEAADEQRGGHGISVIPGPRSETEEYPMLAEDGSFRVASDDEEKDATISFGPSDVGGFVRFVPESDRTPVGPSLAPRVVAGLRAAEAIWEIEIGWLEPARPVR